MRKYNLMVVFWTIVIITSCSKGNKIEPLPTEIKDSLNEKIIDYSNFDFNKIAELNGSYILDTLWNNKEIIGYKVRHPSDQPFYYSTDFTKEPLINSFVSLNTYPFNWEIYLNQSAMPSGRFSVNSYSSSKVHPLDFSIRNWEELNKLVKSHINKFSIEKIFGHKDVIFSFHKYEDLRLIFGNYADIFSLFNIKNKKISHEGLLYYSLRETLSTTSFTYESDFNNAFSPKELSDDNIARVKRLYYGKIAYMIIDAPENTKLLINRLITYGVNKLNQSEITKVNNLNINFYFVGYNHQDLKKMDSYESNLEKVIFYGDLAINRPQDVEFTIESMGVPVYYELNPYMDKHKNFDYTINFNN